MGCCLGILHAIPVAPVLRSKPSGNDLPPHILQFAPWRWERKDQIGLAFAVIVFWFLGQAFLSELGLTVHWMW